MHISQTGIDLIISFEGFRSKAYRAVPGEQYLTIGYGHYGPDVKMGQEITKAAALELLKTDLVKYESPVNYFDKIYNFSQNSFDALVSFTYNCGASNLSNLCKNGKRTKAEIADALLLYNKGAGGVVYEGLKRRRKAERELFLMDADHTYDCIAKPTIKRGIKSEEVKKLQENLNKVLADLTPLDIDGSCGPKTQAKIKIFQKRFNLDQDGSYGPKSYAKMKEVYPYEH